MGGGVEDVGVGVVVEDEVGGGVEDVVPVRQHRLSETGDLHLEKPFTTSA